MGSAGRTLGPGVRLGRYELVEWLGEGGFAEVWLARTTDATGGPRRVAIKLMRRLYAAQERTRKMLLEEGRLASLVVHPNVVSVIEVADDGGTLYLVMEYLSRGSVDELAERAAAVGGLLRPEIVIRIVLDVCAGLHAAHELVVEGRHLDLVHRDVSPHNVLLNESGVAKLTDFGISKARERLAEETTAGVARGKLRYMSPEQATGVSVDRRADVWSVGALLFELLLGRPVYDTENDILRLRALASPRRVVMPPELPEPIARVVSRALEKDLEKRFSTAEELRAELERAARSAGWSCSHEDVRQYVEGLVAREQAWSGSMPPPSFDETASGAVTDTHDTRIPSRKSRRAWLLVVPSVVLLGLGLWRETHRTATSEPRTAATISLDAGAARTVLTTDASPPTLARDVTAASTPEAAPSRPQGTPRPVAPRRPPATSVGAPKPPIDSRIE